jgi:hypothetical protein
VPISAGGHFSTELPARSLPLGSRAARAEANRVNANGGTLHDDATVIARTMHCGEIGVGPRLSWISQAFFATWLGACLHIGWDWLGVNYTETQSVGVCAQIDSAWLHGVIAGVHSRDGRAAPNRLSRIG